MLRLKSLTINNFGPYYGTQTIDFPQEDGVVFIWALNGTGKTSLLNAIRFALFGSLRDSKYAKTPLNHMINLSAVSEGKGMSVRIDCSSNGESGYIIRRLERNGIGDGSRLEDYNLSTSVNWQNQVLSQEQAKAKLEKLLPSNIARFYLFDAELLDQYAKLTEEDVNNENLILKQSIEGILGLPILEESCLSISLFQKNLDALWETESKKNTRLQKKGEVLKMYIQRRNQIESELSDLKQKLRDLVAERDDYQLKLNENSNFRDVLAKEDSCLEKIKGLEEFVSSKSNELSDNLEYLWAIIFNVSLDKVIDTKEKEIKDLESSHAQEEGELLVASVLKIISSNNISACPVCHSSINEQQLSDIKMRLKDISLESPEYKLKMELLRSDITSISKIREPRSIEDIIRCISSFETYNNRLQSAQVELAEIRNKKSSFHSDLTDGDLKHLAEDLSKTLSKIDVIVEGIANLESELKQQKENIDKIKESLANSGDINLDSISVKQKFIDKLSNVFEIAINRFRDNLKKKVEESATSFFTQISHDKDYSSLRINDNYGLEIITEKGLVVPNRSEGFEQVVAVSLLAALHNNTPITGPIVMDSTFQRIDAIHKDNTLKSLPYFGKQIIVLCYPTEVDINQAKNQIGSYYLKDFYVKKVDSLKSIITDNF